MWALASVPVTAWIGRLSFAQLCAVAVVQTAATIGSTAASNPYLKALTPVPVRARVNSRLETTTWTASTLGPPFGGLLVSATSPIISMLIDAVSYLLAAVGWTRIRHRESPPQADVRQGRLADTVGGWHYILAQPALRLLFANAMVLSPVLDCWPFELR